MLITTWTADWADGFGFLSQIVDSRLIRLTGGSVNLSVKDPIVDALLDKAVTTPEVAARDTVWGAVDKKVMEDAFILPGVVAKSLLHRLKNLTNVFISGASGGYDYLALGVKQ